MLTPREIQRFDESPLTDVLTALYPVGFLRSLHKSHLVPLAKANPQTLPQPEPARGPGKNQYPVKAVIIELLVAILADRLIARQFIGNLDPAVQKALRILTWESKMPLGDLESSVGEEIGHSRDESVRFNHHLVASERFGFICLMKKVDASHYGSFNQQGIDRDSIVSLLPRALRTAFKKVLPPPADYNLQPLDGFSECLGQYACHDQALTDIRVATEYIVQGHVLRGKSKAVNKYSLKNLRKIICGREFFESPSIRIWRFSGPASWSRAWRRSTSRSASEWSPRTPQSMRCATSTYDTWQYNVLVNEHNAFSLLVEPLVKGYTFLLAAFGAVEIAYDLPTNPLYHRSNKPYLTPFDGLRFVRITPLGEFVFGHTETCDVSINAKPRGAIVLDEIRLMAFSDHTDPLTDLALDRVMERIAPGHFRMTFRSFLSRCSSRGDVEEQIRLFRRTISKNPPPMWEHFFEQALQLIPFRTHGQLIANRPRRRRFSKEANRSCRAKDCLDRSSF